MSAAVANSHLKHNEHLHDAATVNALVGDMWQALVAEEERLQVQLEQQLLVRVIVRIRCAMLPAAQAARTKTERDRARTEMRRHRGRLYKNALATLRKSLFIRTDLNEVMNVIRQERKTLVQLQAQVDDILSNINEALSKLEHTLTKCSERQVDFVMRRARKRSFLYNQHRYLTRILDVFN